MLLNCQGHTANSVKFSIQKGPTVLVLSKPPTREWNVSLPFLQVFPLSISYSPRATHSLEILYFSSGWQSRWFPPDAPPPPSFVPLCVLCDWISCADFYKGGLGESLALNIASSLELLLVLTMGLGVNSGPIGKNLTEIRLFCEW